jgi:hypothetical protein
LAVGAGIVVGFLAWGKGREEKRAARRRTTVVSAEFELYESRFG